MAAAMLTLDFCGDLLDQGLILKGATPLLMYRPIPHSQIIDDLMHLRDLYREGRPANEREQLAHDAREAFTKDLIGNLSRMKEHLMPGIIAEAARHFRLTVDGAHRLFGYNLSDIQAYDLRLNGSRTRLIESYAFDQDLLIDLPLRFGEDEMFHRTAFLRDLVPEWQTNIPIRGLYERGWQRPGMLYVRIGIADSLGWNLPPGSIASVEPMGRKNASIPDWIAPIFFSSAMDTAVRDAGFREAGCRWRSQHRVIPDRMTFRVLEKSASLAGFTCLLWNCRCRSILRRKRCHSPGEARP